MRYKLELFGDLTVWAILNGGLESQNNHVELEGIEIRQTMWTYN